MTALRLSASYLHFMALPGGLLAKLRLDVTGFDLALVLGFQSPLGALLSAGLESGLKEPEAG